MTAVIVLLSILVAICYFGVGTIFLTSSLNALDLDKLATSKDLPFRARLSTLLGWPIWGVAALFA